jgi:hypothetical protein
VPAESRSGEICETEEVERDGEEDARETMAHGCVPCYLWAVDGEMRGDGAEKALLYENFGALGLGSRQSVKVISTWT